MTYILLCVSVNGFEPDFLFPLENVTIAQGRDAIFTCVVNNIGGNRVSAPEGGFAPARVGISKNRWQTKTIYTKLFFAPRLRLSHQHSFLTFCRLYYYYYHCYYTLASISPYTDTTNYRYLHHVGSLYARRARIVAIILRANNANDLHIFFPFVRTISSIEKNSPSPVHTCETRRRSFLELWSFLRRVVVLVVCTVVFCRRVIVYVGGGHYFSIFLTLLHTYTHSFSRFIFS